MVECVVFIFLSFTSVVWVLDVCLIFGLWVLCSIVLFPFVFRYWRSVVLYLSICCAELLSGCPAEDWIAGQFLVTGFCFCPLWFTPLTVTHQVYVGTSGDKIWLCCPLAPAASQPKSCLNTPQRLQATSMCIMCLRVRHRMHKSIILLMFHLPIGQFWTLYLKHLAK